jgi:hypothetical protein
MSSVAMSKIQIVVIILIKAFTAAPGERHGKRRSSWVGVGGATAPKKSHNICMLYLNSWRLHTRESPWCTSGHCPNRNLVRRSLKEHNRDDLVCVAILATRSIILGDRKGKFTPPAESDRHSSQRRVYINLLHTAERTNNHKVQQQAQSKPLTIN